MSSGTDDRARRAEDRARRRQAVTATERRRARERRLRLRRLRAFGAVLALSAALVAIVAVISSVGAGAKSMATAAAPITQSATSSAPPPPRPSSTSTSSAKSMTSTSTTSTGAERTRPKRKPQPEPKADAADAAAAQVAVYAPVVASGSSRRRAIALSFDDGPGPYTPDIVDVLVKRHVPATFFVVGQQLRYFSEGLRDEIEHGFEIGDHTENHAWLIRLSPAGQYAQIHDDAVTLERHGAPAPQLMRPPYGAYNSTTVTTARSLGMLTVLWSIDPQDWRRPGVGAIVSNVLRKARPGAIVLMHDGGGDRSQTLAALPAVIDGLRRRGYDLVSVPELMKLDPPPRQRKAPQVSEG